MNHVGPDGSVVVELGGVLAEDLLVKSNDVDAGALAVKEADQDEGRLLESDGSAPLADGLDDAKGEEVPGEVLAVGLGRQAVLLVHLVHELEGTGDEGCAENQVGNGPDGLDEAEEVTSVRAATVHVEEGVASAGETDLDGLLDGGHTSVHGGQDARKDAEEAAGVGEEQRQLVLELAAGANVAPEGGDDGDGSGDDLVRQVQAVDLGDPLLEIGEGHAGVPEADFALVLLLRALAVGANLRAVLAALVVVSEVEVLQLGDEVNDVAEVVAALTRKSEGASVCGGH